MELTFVLKVLQQELRLNIALYALYRTVCLGVFRTLTILEAPHPPDLPSLAQSRMVLSHSTPFNEISIHRSSKSTSNSYAGPSSWDRHLIISWATSVLMMGWDQQWTPVCVLLAHLVRSLRSLPIFLGFMCSLASRYVKTKCDYLLNKSPYLSENYSPL